MLPFDAPARSASARTVRFARPCSITRSSAAPSSVSGACSRGRAMRSGGACAPLCRSAGPPPALRGLLRREPVQLDRAVELDEVAGRQQGAGLVQGLDEPRVVAVG